MTAPASDTLPKRSRACSAGLPPLSRARRQPQDTVEGCRERAAADLAAAAALDASRGRWKFEHSAAAWTTRADMLARIEGRHQDLIRGRQG